MIQMSKYIGLQIMHYDNIFKLVLCKEMHKNKLLFSNNLPQS